MDPDYKTPPNMQGVYGPPPADIQQPSFQPPKPLKSSKRKFVILAGVVFVAVGILVVVFNLPSQKKTPPPSQDTADSHSDAEGPRPATAVTTEQDNNAISQEIGNLNDDQDFPTDQLSDENLDL